MFSNICCDKPETDIIFQCRLATRLEAIAIRLEAIAISNKKLLIAPGITTRVVSSKKLLTRHRP